MPQILGIGNDIIEIARIEESIKRHPERFLNRLFTSREQEYCSSHKNSTTHFAGRFAAKEAIVKSLGTGFSEGITWLDIEILNDEKGKPYVTFSSRLNELFNFPNILISISHCHAYATAFAIWHH